MSGKRICLRPAYSNEIRNGVFSTESKRWQKRLEKYLGKNSNGRSWQNNDFSRRCKLKSEFGECVYDSKFEHRRPNNFSLQNNSKEHWEVKIIHIQAVAAEGT